MTANEVIIRKYTADEGKVFDWAEPRYHQEPKNPNEPEGEQVEIQDHLYAKQIFLGLHDSIENYIEIEEVAANEDTE